MILPFRKEDAYFIENQTKDVDTGQNFGFMHKRHVDHLVRDRFRAR